VLATVLSRTFLGMQAPQVIIEAHVGPGLPCTSIVGLGDATLKESKDRVRSALTTANFEYPAGRITINLAPADLPKDGGRFDLAIALAILAASEQIPANGLDRCEFYGELALSGQLRPIRGILPAIFQAAAASHRVILPHQNLTEASIVPRAQIAGATHLLEVCNHLRKVKPFTFAASGMGLPSTKDIAPTTRASRSDLADIRGQRHPRRALEIAAAGAHHLFFAGPPGAGKSMLARRLPGILPPLTYAEAIEVAAVASMTTDGFQLAQWARRPFRSPHHTVSTIALIGGGAQATPGEISLAHNGVLLLDEFPEFDRQALEALREPLETASIAIARAAYRAEFPARFQLVATMNPCPCGYQGDPEIPCTCRDLQIQRYREKVSGPLLDRFDLHVAVKRSDPVSLAAPSVPAETTAQVAARVFRARQIQLDRQSTPNARLDDADVERYCAPEPEGRAVLERAARRFGFSARAYYHILKVARTIADLDDSAAITPAYLSEAILFRQLPSNQKRGGSARDYRASPRRQN
jgi:magnesium chelatase family protein